MVLAAPGPFLPPPLPRVTTATLSVAGAPAGAEVLVDGVKRGTVPCEVEIDLGAEQEKTVSVVMQASGYEPAGANVRLEPGKTEAWEKTLQARQQGTPTATPVVSVPGKATIAFAGTPQGADVYVDDTRVGTLPCDIELDLAGNATRRVNVRVTAPEHDAQSFEVDLRAGERWPMPVALRRSTEGAPTYPPYRPALTPSTLGWGSDADVHPGKLLVNERDGALMAWIPGIEGGKGWWVYTQCVTQSRLQAVMGSAGETSATGQDPTDPPVRVTKTDALAYASEAGGRLPSTSEISHIRELWKRDERLLSLTPDPFSDEWQANTRQRPSTDVPSGWGRPIQRYFRIVLQ